MIFQSIINVTISQFNHFIWPYCLPYRLTICFAYCLPYDLFIFYFYWIGLWADLVYRSICPSVCLFVNVFTFWSTLKTSLCPTSQSWMSKFFRDSVPLRKSNEKKWSQIWELLLIKGEKLLLIFPCKAWRKPCFPMD